MSLKTATLDTDPTSYWPLDDDVGGSCHDEAGLHNATMAGAGIKLAAIPFGTASAPYFDGDIGSVLTVVDDALSQVAGSGTMAFARGNCRPRRRSAARRLRRFRQTAYAARRS
jgi:hypothetical protein